MPKFLGNRIGYATTTSSDGGIFNLHSQQIFLKILEKWPPLKTVSSTGATVTEVSPTRQKYHVFTGSGSFTVSNGDGYVHYTIVAGGGGGGTGENRYINTAAGGGGAGGFRSGTVLLGPGNYTVTVGDGGTGGAAPPYSNNARSGSPSSISGPSSFATIESTGGGRGGTYYPYGLGAGDPGGSGGGGASPSGRNTPTNYSDGGEGNTPSVSPPQGNPGGWAGTGGGGGGGGCSTHGGTGIDYDYGGTDNSRTGKGGDGGQGRDWGVIAEDQFSGLTLGPFAGGGGGGGGHSQPVRTTVQPNGGVGADGGGNGGDAHYPIPGTSPVKWGSPGTDGSQNTGGGGGGGSAGSSPSNYPNFFGGDGGSGIIIISHSYE